MVQNPYQAPDHVASDPELTRLNSDPSADLTAIRRAVLFLTLASLLAAVWFAFQFCAVTWMVVSGYFQDSGFASTDVVGIVLDRGVWRGILLCMYMFIALRLYFYAKGIHGVLTTPESGKEELYTAQRRVWFAIVSLIVVFVVWKAVMFVVFGFLFRGWGDW